MGTPTSILTPLLDYVPDGDVDVLVVLAGVRLGGLAPAAVQQDACRRHARGRWHGFLAARHVRVNCPSHGGEVRSHDLEGPLDAAWLAPAPAQR